MSLLISALKTDLIGVMSNIIKDLRSTLLTLINFENNNGLTGREKNVLISHCR